MKKILSILAITAIALLALTACDEVPSTSADMQNTLQIGDKLALNQPTPTDIEYSYHRHNLIRRTYWVNGEHEKACAVISPFKDMPIALIQTYLPGVATPIKEYLIEGPVTSLNSYLTPDSEYYEVNTGSSYTIRNPWLPDVDGTYGTNESGIFFFTVDCQYKEWTGIYELSDVPLDYKKGR